MNAETREAISKITETIIEVSDGENDAASDNLDFSVWAAAFATAASGLILIHGHTIAEGSWIGKTLASYFLLAAQPLLFASIIIAGIVRHFINQRRSAARDLNDLYRLQEVSPEPEPLPCSSADIFLKVMDGAYLFSSTQLALREKYKWVLKLTERYRFFIRCQLSMIGISYGILLVVGIRIPH